MTGEIDPVLFALEHSARMLREKDMQILVLKADAFDIINDMFKQSGSTMSEPDYLGRAIQQRQSELIARHEHE